MSYQEKRIIVSILTGIFLLAAYCIYTLGKIRAGVAAPEDIRFWAISILIFIGVGIAAAIIIQIVFHILLSIAIAVKENGRIDEKEIEKTIEMEMVEDEMDKLIGLKSLRIGYAITMIGFVSALITLVFDYSPAVMLNILFASVSIGSMIEGITQLYYYRSGIKNG